MKRNLTLVLALLLTVCLKAQTVVNISGAKTATWTAPSSGGPFLVRITARGGDGGWSITQSYEDVNPGGQGATMSGIFTIQNGESILAISGSKGGTTLNEMDLAGAGGGAGSGAVRIDNINNRTILIIAGGGNGAGYFQFGGEGKPAQITSGSGDGGMAENITRGAGGGGTNGPGDRSVDGGGGGGQISLIGISSGGTGDVVGGSGMGGGGGSVLLGAGGGGGGQSGGGHSFLTRFIGACSLPGGVCQDNSAGTWPATLQDARDGYVKIELLTADETYYLDKDGDGYGDVNNNTPGIEGCRPQGYVTNSDDCDDTNAALNPATVWYKDADNDGYSDGITATQCTRPNGFKLTSELTATSSDCDDSNTALTPTTTWYKDADNDSYSDGASLTQCTRPANYKLASELTAISGDCDETNTTLSPATIWYKDEDNDSYSNGTTAIQCTRPTGFKLSSELTSTSGDCDDTKTELNLATIWYKDADNDGYSEGTTATQCTKSTGFKLSSELTATSGDCDDTKTELNPATVWYKDADNDGYSDGAIATQCTKPTGFKLSSELTATSSDCDDTKAELNPATVWYKDADNDGYSDGTTTTQCTKPTGYKLAPELTAITGDCNDNDILIHSAQTYYLDSDKDGYGNSSKIISVCSSTVPGGYVKNNKDCNDSDPAISPVAVEVCGNKVDDNCNGVIDEQSCSPCRNATNLNTSNITSTSAQLNWSVTANPQQWQLQYKTTGQGAKWIDVLLTGNIRSVKINNLLAKQNYNWHVRAKCNGKWTDYSNAVSFTTSGSSGLSNRPLQAEAESGKQISEEYPGIQLYPNPTSRQFVIELHVSGNINTTAKIEMVNMLGQTVSTESANVSNGILYKTVSLSPSLAKGIYMVKVVANNKTYLKRLMYGK